MINDQSMYPDGTRKATKILMLVTFFAPDSSISAVRPSMFTRNLTKLGYEVTVIRSGRINGKADDSFTDVFEKIRVISYDGENSPAELYRKGIWETPSEIQKGTRHFPFIKNESLRRFCKTFWDPISFLHYMYSEKEKIKKAVLNSLSKESFDIVFASFGDIGNIVAGPYVAKKYKCKLICDFRDRVFSSKQTTILRVLCHYLQKKYSRVADVCTAVSASLANELKHNANENTFLLYNGYDPINHDDSSRLELQDDKNILRLFYGGDMYNGLRDFSALFQVIKSLANDGEISLSKIRLEYAGAAYQVIYDQAKQYNVQEIIHNNGYIPRRESNNLQSSCDVFLVASWNTKYEQGVLTGKFYEAIQHRMPVIAIVTGNVANSELREIISSYRLGVCYEQADHDETYRCLQQFILDSYKSKQLVKIVPFNPNNAVFDMFSYDKLSDKLNRIIQSELNH